jgi:hypothetical protein
VNIQNKNKSTSSFSSKSNLKIEKQKKGTWEGRKKGFWYFFRVLMNVFLFYNEEILLKTKK